MKFLLFIIVNLAISELVCRLPIISHTFNNCPILIRRNGHPDPPSGQYEYLCENEGTCKITGFYANTTYYDSILNETCVNKGQSYEGFCSCKILTAEFLAKNPEDQGRLEFKVHNLWIRISEYDILLDDGISLFEPIICENCIPNDTLLHIFIFFINDEDTGFTSIKIIINKEVVLEVENLFLITGDNIVTLYHGCVYQYALYEQTLTTTIIEELTNKGLDREADEEFCMDEDTISEINLKEGVKQNWNLFWVFLSVVGFMSIAMVFSCLFTYCLRFVMSTKVKT